MGQPPKKLRRGGENEETEGQMSEELCQAPICRIVKLGQSASASPQPQEEEDDMRRDWICCDVCEKWYHYSCVQIEEWEILIIDKYHCPACSPTEGPSIQRKVANRHRFEFYKSNVDHLRTQTGTPKWMDSFVVREKEFPEPPAGMIKVLDNGNDLKNHLKPDEVWTTPFKIKNKEGLGMKVPDRDFTLADVVKIMGRDRSVDTIDVYGQNTYPMSLGRFLDLFESDNRERLYNILSLEFSACEEMAALVAPPSIVGEISWVHRFWPEVMHTAHKHLYKENDFSNELTWIKTCNRATDLYNPYDEHQKARPDVALFCLAGMGGSFTDYHIDFGGSSVWYNVFKGEKIFYIIEPTEENIGLYHQHQLSPSRHENFLGDQEGVKSYRVVVKEGETLLIPSGWIHAVYTPVDSLVFGGNFLHWLNIRMQIRINALEEEQRINVRFRYPSFELCNRYAASLILAELRKCRKSDTPLPKHFEDGMQTLINEMRKWDKLEAKSPYALVHPSYGPLTDNLKNEYAKYKKRMRKRRTATPPQAPKADKLKRVDLSNTIKLEPISQPVVMKPLSAIPLRTTSNSPPSEVNSSTSSSACTEFLADRPKSFIARAESLQSSSTWASQPPKVGLPLANLPPHAKLITLKSSPIRLIASSPKALQSRQLVRLGTLVRPAAPGAPPQVIRRLPPTSTSYPRPSGSAEPADRITPPKQPAAGQNDEQRVS